MPMGQVDISDALRVLFFLFVESITLPCADAADTDDTGELTATDAIRLLGYLFLSQAPPPAPGMLCGKDPTDDDILACAEYNPCRHTHEPLFGSRTPLEPAIVENTPGALITRIADRARDRHAREDQFHAYDHYLSFYWEHRTAAIEIVDTIGKGGTTIKFNVTAQWKFSDNQAELRF